MSDLAHTIEDLFKNHHKRDVKDIHKALDTFINGLNQGTIRVSEKKGGTWRVNTWVKQGILLYFKMHQSTMTPSDPTPYFDKIPLRLKDMDVEAFKALNARFCPGSIVREGAYIGPSAILMPSFVNIGAYIGEKSMIDSWATIGSCAQIGSNVHISGGVGIGGVLEPEGAQPVIIEDHCFIGARSEVTEGVIIEEGAVLGMGVYLSQSTKIYDREKDKVLYGRIPAGSVVVPGSLPSQIGHCHLQCAVIVKQVDLQTRQKIGINALLRSP